MIMALWYSVGVEKRLYKDKKNLFSHMHVHVILLFRQSHVSWPTEQKIMDMPINTTLSEE